MEDSYTVHRRRKAAARKREKTPEPPRRNQEDVTGSDEEEEARARMERMVQETERLEELEESARQRAELAKSAEREAAGVAEKPNRSLKRAMSPEVRRREEEAEREEGKEEEAKVEVLTLGMGTLRPNSEKERADGKGPKRSSAGPEVAEERAKDRKEEAGSASSGGSSRGVKPERRRPEVDKDLSPETPEKPTGSASPGGSRGVKPERRRAEVQKDLSPEAPEMPAGSASPGGSRGVKPERRRPEVDKDLPPETPEMPSGSASTGGSRGVKSERRRAEVEKDLSPETPENPTGSASTGGSSRGVKPERRRAEVEKDLSPDTEKPARSVRKAMSPEVERSRPEADERRRESAGTEAARKTPRTSDKEDDQETAASDRNRREAASSATRESDAGPARDAGGKSESVKIQDRRRDAEEEPRSPRGREAPERSSTRPPEEFLRVRKREVTSPSKARNSEPRASGSTTKRAAKERDLERTGYTTDSSETEEITRRAPRRRKSPEDGKPRPSGSRKTPSRSRVATDTDGDVDDQERSRRTERRSASRRGRASDTDEDRREAAPRAPSRQAEKPRSGEKRSSGGRSRHPSDTEDDRRAVRKSGSFPVDAPRDASPSMARSASDVKKQIIPLSDDSLIEDFERAQREYLRRERGILDRDPQDDYVDPAMAAALRRRKFSVVQPEVDGEEVEEVQPARRSWFGWVPFFGKATKEKPEEARPEVEEQETKPEVEKKTPRSGEEKFDGPMAQVQETPKPKRVSFLEFFRTLADFVAEFRAFVELNPNETRCIRLLRNRCLVELLLAVIYCGLGAFVFRFTEGAFETFYKCGVKRVKRDFLDSLWNFSHNMREEDWKSMARRKLMEFEEQLHTAHEAGVHSYSGQKSWSFLNAVVYCLTVITTIGYGHISPSTTTGRAITIVYAIFGIPMFLIILADFGKLFTRGIKFLWAFVRRVYYTGSCRRVRRTGPVQEVMKGVQLVYDLATFRRPSQMNPEEIQEIQKQQTQTVLNLDGSAPPSATVPPDTPGTPAMSAFAIDDEFNLPISVAIFILLVYIFVGATVYNFWEEWGFFESFYFVFISMSTIGFGDYVPKHPIYMMLSIVYLVFGLALTSMCINVVQVMLSDSFKQASQKIGATIGFEVAEDDGSAESAPPDPVEVADVHPTIKESESKEQVAPKAKQENVDL